MNVPKLRFKEFDGEFIKYNIEQLVEVTDCKHDTAPVEAEKTIYKMIRTGNVRNGNLLVETMDSVSEDTFHKWSLRGYLEPNDIILTREAPMGEVALIPRNSKYNFFLGQRCLQLKSNAELADSVYIYFLLQGKRFQKYIRPLKSSGSTVSNIRIPELKSFEFEIPDIKEQIKVGDFLGEINKKIQLQQQKIDLLQEQKKGFLQKMFPKAGETQPEIRFEGFTENWKPHKLSDGMIEYTERVFIEDEKLYKQISVKNIGEITIRGEKIGSEIGRKRQARVNLDEHPYTLIFTRQTVEQGGIGFAPKQTNGAIVTENMPTIEVDVRIFDKDYLLALFKTSLWYRDIILFNVEGGTAQVAIHEDNILSSETVFPSIEEQKNIGAFFKNLNKKIEVEQKKIELLQKQKQGIMQQMFI